MLNDWKFYIIVYLIVSVIFNQGYKVVTKSIKNDGAITILIQLIASFICVLMIPLFKIKFPSDYKILEKNGKKYRDRLKKKREKIEN